MPLQVYRGVPADGLEMIKAKYGTGTEIWWSGFTSTSTDLTVSKDFAEW